MALIAALSRFSSFGTLVNRYHITPSTNAVNEGGTVTFTVLTFGMPDGTIFYYSIEGSDITSDDFTDGSLTGSFAVTNDTGTVTKTLSLDGTVEISSSFTMNIRLDSVTGPIAISSSPIYVTDGSVIVYPASSTVDEGSSLQFVVSTTDSPASTLYWDIDNISTTNSDFVAVSGSVSISAGSGTFNITTIADLSTEGNQSFRVNIRSQALSGPIAATSSTVTIYDTSITPYTQVEYTTAGTYTWTCPAGVTSVSVVCVGGAGGGYSDSSTPPIGSNYYSATGSGGGGLGYKNNISVTPGQTYTVVAGAAGTWSQGVTRGTNGGDSYFISSATVKGGGGVGAWGGAYLGTDVAGGTYVGDGGGNGGIGGYAMPFSYSLGGGGGGAGGYSGNGGAGGNETITTGGNGSGGGGGGGNHSPYPGSRAYGGQGGGVGLLGQGTNGTGGFSGGSTTVGNAGSAGSGGTAALYGGGAGGNTSSNGRGAVRIIWPGTTRQFPSTLTIDYIPLTLTVAIPFKALNTSTSITAFTPITPATYSGSASTLTFEISPALPDGLSFNTTTGTITGSTQSNEVPQTTYNVSVTDSFGFTKSATFDLKIQLLGQAAYTTGGTYSWVCPAGVTSVSVVCIGGGAGGGTTTGGGGGGLGYKNNITVVPGTSYTVVVGTFAQNGAPGNQSYFITPSTVSGGAGSVGTGGSYIGDGGGNGGAGGTGTTNKGGGAGGAGGYAGNGGRGGDYFTANATAGSGGGGGGGRSTNNATPTYKGGAGGGGTGIFGQGSNGAAGADWQLGGGGGSGGQTGFGGSSSTISSSANGGTGGSYGGGGGGKGTSTSVGGTGAGGAVRIIWPGTDRQFPSTRTVDE